MSWHCQKYGGYSRQSTEAYDNCLQIYGILSSLGWTLNAVCGVLGNMESESGYNPWRWQSDIVLSSTDPNISISSAHAYGLVQWDPASKYINNASGLAGYGPNFDDIVGRATDGHAQMLYLDAHADYYSTSAYPVSYDDYKINTNDYEWNAKCWFYNFERGTWDDGRVAAAHYWFDEFGGITPPGPTPGLKDDILILKHFIDKNRRFGYII